MTSSQQKEIPARYFKCTCTALDKNNYSQIDKDGHTSLYSVSYSSHRVHRKLALASVFREILPDIILSATIFVVSYEPLQAGREQLWSGGCKVGCITYTLHCGFHRVLSVCADT